MPAEVVDNVPRAEVDAVRTGLMTGSALRVMQKKNPDGTYRLTVFHADVNDLFIPYAVEDLDLCVRDFGSYRQ